MSALADKQLEISEYIRIKKITSDTFLECSDYRKSNMKKTQQTKTILYELYKVKTFKEMESLCDN